jgi:hypothetical protein
MSNELSKGQRRRLNKAWRKAGLFGKASTAERKAQVAVDKRVQLADLMSSKDIGRRVAARKEYKRISGEYQKPSGDVKGFWNANAARGRTKAASVPV